MEGYDVILDVMNNGKPLREDLTEESTFEYGRSTSNETKGHFGIGCYQIKELMGMFGGDVKLISKPDASDGFTVTYRLVFKNNNIESRVDNEL